MYLRLEPELVAKEALEATRRHGKEFLLSIATAFAHLHEETGVEDWISKFREIALARYDDIALRSIFMEGITDPDFPVLLRGIISHPLAVRQLRHLNDERDQRCA